MERAAVEVGHRDHPRLPLRVHAGRRGMTAQREHRRVGDLDLDRIARELGLGPHELEAALLAHRAAAAVATHEPARANALLAGMDGDFVVRSLEAVDAVAAPDLDADGERVSGEDALEMLHLDSRVGCRPGPGAGTSTATNRCCCSRTGCPRSGRPARGAAIRTRSIQVSAGRGTLVGTRLRRDLFQQAAPVEGFDARAPEPSHSEREPLQGRVRILQLFEHQHGELREPQLAGQEQADRAGPGDDHVVDHGVLLARRLGPALSDTAPCTNGTERTKTERMPRRRPLRAMCRWLRTVLMRLTG